MAGGRLFLYSPIKPLKTGTANYFDLFLEQLESTTLPEDLEVIIVVDKIAFRQVDDIYKSTYRVEDFRHINRGREDTSMYFLANNEFHRYIHRVLYEHRDKDGVAISLVHEPDMWMNVEAMCNLEEYGFGQKNLAYFARYEFGENAEFFCSLFERGRTDQNFQYSSLAGTHIYDNSDIIVFHSYFARAKFLLERSLTYNARSRDRHLLVMSHPPENILARKTDPKPRNEFVVGTYGWVKKVKQIEAIIEAFNDFYRDLDVSDRNQVRLDIVGEVDVDDPNFDPIGLAASMLSASKIHFYGYLPDKKLNALMNQASVALSLRFPSCGETSGPLFKAQALGLKTVLSDYAAFAEEPADYHISIQKEEQHDQIVDILNSEFKAFKSGKNKQKANDELINKHRPKLTVGELLDKVLAFSDNGGDCL